MSAPGSTITASTRYCAVYGHPIKHSASPAMQNAGLAALGLNWRYLAFAVHPDDLRAAIAGAKAMKFIGLNLTVPHKLLAMNLVEELDESGKLWGAVNTIRFEARDAQGQWQPLACFGDEIPGEIRAQGFNTDADAVTRALTEEFKLDLRGASVLLLGAGGAGRVAALKLASEGIKSLFLVNRTPDKAGQIALEVRHRFATVRVRVSSGPRSPDPARTRELAAEIARRYPQISIFGGYPREKVDLVINATSLGLKENDPLPVDEKWLRSRHPRFVYDMIYRPAETPLLQAAKSAGCRTANGLSMLLYQGAKALEIWSGQPAPLEEMRRALMKHVYG